MDVEIRLGELGLVLPEAPEPIGNYKAFVRAVVTVHQVVRDMNGNVIADGMVEHVYLIEDDLIKSMEIRRP